MTGPLLFVLLVVLHRCVGFVCTSGVGLETKLGMFGRKKATPVAKGIVIPDCDKEAAYMSWLDANDFLPETAPAYMTESECKAKFTVLVNAIKDSSAAVAMVQNDPIVFGFSETKLVESFQSWATRLESEEEARLLLVRAPALMSLSNEKVVDADKNEIIQSYFWSYFGAATRVPTKALLALLKPVKKAMMSN